MGFSDRFFFYANTVRCLVSCGMMLFRNYVKLIGGWVGLCSLLDLFCANFVYFFFFIFFFFSFLVPF